MTVLCLVKKSVNYQRNETITRIIFIALFYNGDNMPQIRIIIKLFIYSKFGNGKIYQHKNFSDIHVTIKCVRNLYFWCNDYWFSILNADKDVRHLKNRSSLSHLRRKYVYFVGLWFTFFLTPSRFVCQPVKPFIDSKFSFYMYLFIQPVINLCFFMIRYRLICIFADIICFIH